MKITKFAAVLSALVFASSAASAAVKVNMWGRTGLDMLEYDTDTKEYTMGFDPSTYGYNGRIALNFEGNNKTNTLGFKLSIDYNGLRSVYAENNDDSALSYDNADTFGLDDNAYMWGKIFGATITMGKMMQDDLRGSSAFAGLSINGGMDFQDIIFPRFEVLTGLHVDYKIGGLYVAGAIDAYQTDSSDTYGSGFVKHPDLYSVYRTVQTAIAYKFPNNLTLKAQYIGPDYDEDLSTRQLNFGIHYKNSAIEAEYGFTVYPDDWEETTDTYNASSGSGGVVINHWTAVPRLSADSNGIHMGAGLAIKAVPNFTFTLQGAWFNTQEGRWLADFNTVYNLGLYDVGLTTEGILEGSYLYGAGTAFIKRKFAGGYISAGLRYEYHEYEYKREWTGSANQTRKTDSYSVIKIPVGMSFYL